MEDYLHTSTGHYEYLVLLSGFSNELSVVKAFINDVLNRYVVIYLDDMCVFGDNA